MVLPLAGIAEICARVPVTKQSVDYWTRAASFPQPVARLAAGKVYWWPEVAPWIVRCGKADLEGWQLDLPRPEKLDLVGVGDIANRVGVQATTVANWRVRHDDFPPPVAVLRMGTIHEWPPVWTWLAWRR